MATRNAKKPVAEQQAQKMADAAVPFEVQVRRIVRHELEIRNPDSFSTVTAIGPIPGLNLTAGASQGINQSSKSRVMEAIDGIEAANNKISGCIEQLGSYLDTRLGAGSPMPSDPASPNRDGQSGHMLDQIDVLHRKFSTLQGLLARLTDL